jgi:hypothetical protein
MIFGIAVYFYYLDNSPSKADKFCCSDNVT